MHDSGVVLSICSSLYFLKHHIRFGTPPLDCWRVCKDRRYINHTQVFRTTITPKDTIYAFLMTICTHQEDEGHDGSHKWFFLTSNLSIFRLFSTNQSHGRKFAQNKKTTHLSNNQWFTFNLQHNQSIFQVLFTQKHCIKGDTCMTLAG